MKLTHKIIGLAAIVFVLLYLFIGAIQKANTSDNPTADELLNQAYQMRTKARRAHCLRLGEKISTCYATGDKDLCSKMQDSIAWFTREYAETPELACSSQDDPLAVGGDQK